MPAAQPTLDLLRSLSDEHVLTALTEAERFTRAELATRTGLSKPTVAESVRRLAAAGLIVDTGERTSGRGGVGSYYALSPDAGCALAVQIAPEGIVVETVDAHGQVTARVERFVPRPAATALVTRTLRQAVRTALAAGGAPARLAAVSAADPVDRTSGRLVQLPDSPFLLGDLSPADALRPLVRGPVEVDNDVNWAARAERAAVPGLDDFAYVYLGEGLGCALVSDGEVIRGRTGIAGEIAHVPTIGRGGRCVAFTEVFAQLGLRHRGAASIDVAALVAALDTDAAARDVLARATTGVLAAIVALSDPQRIIIGGTWGTHRQMVDALRRAFRRQPRSVPLEVSRVAEPALTGARQHAIVALRSALVAAARTGTAAAHA